MNSTTLRGVDYKAVLDRLPVAQGASFDSREEQFNSFCLEGTRVDLLRQIDQWAQAPNAKPIFWLNGMAGTGKSTIARTICRSFAKSYQLASSFFFKRGEADRGSVSRFVTTMAHQLIQRHPVVASHVKSAIDEDPNIAGKASPRQFENLIKNPLRHVSLRAWKTAPLVFVIDALDECDRNEEIDLVISLFSSFKDLDSMLKVIITSRPELPIRLGFNRAKEQYQDLILHNIRSDIIEADIARFLEHELNRIKDEYNSSPYNNPKLGAQWPERSSIQTLVNIAKPLFIFAATVCRFIDARKSESPDGLLKSFMDPNTADTSRLEKTYRPILNRMIKNLNSKETRIVIGRFHKIVGSIIILADPLSVNALAHLLGLPQDTVGGHLNLLHSVLRIPTSPHSPVRLFHLSFRDFLVDPKRQLKDQFWINEIATHGTLASNCMRIMNDNLHTDICQLVRPGTSRSSMTAEDIQSHIPPGLQYACLYWSSHIKQGRVEVDDDGEVYRFFLAHFLHWLEALALMGQAPESLCILETLNLALSVSLYKIASGSRLTPVRQKTVLG